MRDTSQTTEGHIVMPPVVVAAVPGFLVGRLAVGKLTKI